MKHIKSISLVMISTLLLSACNNRLIHNRTEEYRQATSIAPMTIPPEYSSSTVTAYYPVPDNTNTDLEPVDLTPPTIDPVEAH